MCASLPARCPEARQAARQRIYGPVQALQVLRIVDRMSLQDRLAKLRERQLQLTAALREAEAVAAGRQRKQETRAKIILGAVVLAMPAGEREAILSMLLPRATERDRRFIGEHLAGKQPDEPAPPSGLN